MELKYKYSKSYWTRSNCFDFKYKVIVYVTKGTLTDTICWDTNVNFYSSSVFFAF